MFVKGQSHCEEVSNLQDMLSVYNEIMSIYTCLSQMQLLLYNKIYSIPPSRIKNLVVRMRARQELVEYNVSV